VRDAQERESAKCSEEREREIHPFLDGYCSTVQGLLDWFEVDLGFTERACDAQANGFLFTIFFACASHKRESTLRCTSCKMCHMHIKTHKT